MARLYVYICLSSWIVASLVYWNILQKYTCRISKLFLYVGDIKHVWALTAGWMAIKSELLDEVQRGSVPSDQNLKDTFPG